MHQPALCDHIAALRRYARALQCDRVAAEDLVQECLARALSRGHLWREGSDLRAWLFTILHNIHVNDRRAARTHAIADDRAMGVRIAPPAQEARLELRDLERALSRLPVEQRQVLLLVAIEGMSYEEAAAAMGVPIGTIMSRVARGRDALRRQLTQNWVS
ncbi:MAG TPA: sigma-70 family RNA polymerase sigma factor [Stellaceae bacterium]|nr:sigma-70 family RNA polymerase sigma factor [Stellaceae bacterium]